MKTLEQVRTIENDYIRQCGGVWNITEGYWKQNTISRNKVRALKSQYGTCFIGDINKRDNVPVLREYKRGMIYNFGCCFAIPEYNQELVDMIEQYNNKPYSSELMKDIENITDKVNELGGVLLNWV